MAYSVSQLARISGVTVRTLHHYDEVGLLKPSYYGENGYRYYEYEQLMKLQQILFYRELGFELDQIRVIIGSAGFNPISALESHRRVLNKELIRLRQLIGTVNKTIAHIKGAKKMNDNTIFHGFDEEQQKKHEQQLVDRFGPGMKASIAESHKKVKRWTTKDWQRSGEVFAGICRDLVQVMQRRLGPDAPATQVVIRRHFEWLKHFWTPGRESYEGHGQFIMDSDLRLAYEAHHSELPEFAAAAIKVFARSELS